MLSVWPDAYYLTVNEFDAKGVTFLGANVAALDRASMLAGRAATSQSFTTANTISSLLASDVDSAMPPPPGEPNFVMALGEAANTLASFKFHVDFANPASSSLSGPANLPTDPFTQACNGGGTCIPQAGGAQLDSLGDRLMFRLAYRNFGDHESLIASHTVTAGGPTGIRRFEPLGADRPPATLP